MTAEPAGLGSTVWAWARPLGGAALLAALVRQLGTGPFFAGVGTISAWSLVAAMSIALLTTACCAWRWSLVARGLGVEVGFWPAVAAYYRSQFLNTVLPGGVLGDVHRGLHHGRQVDDVSRGLRAVAWERSAGQVVQAALAVVVLLALPSPVRSSMPLVVGAVVLAAIFVVLLARTLPPGGSSRWARALGTARTDVRDGLLAPRAWLGIVTASTLVVAGHVAMFLVAARTAGATESPLRMLPIALLALLAMGLPTNIGGWGPREGVTAWAFAAAGLSASQGFSTAIVYGVLVLVSSLPGALVLVAVWLRRETDQPCREELPTRPVTSSAFPDKVAHGEKVAHG